MNYAPLAVTILLGIALMSGSNIDQECEKRGAIYITQCDTYNHNR